MQMQEAPSSLGTAAALGATPRIHRLVIERFRGIKALTWFPGAGVNLVLGGGDVGKTTILDALGLLLSPTNSSNLADTDYYLRRIEDEFVVEAVMSLPQDGAINQQPKPSWPWEWNGKEPVVPSSDSETPDPEHPVYRLRVRGTADLELVYEIVQPDGTPDHFPVGLRRAIGLVRLSGDDRNDRDLRLVQGSALDRLLSDKTLRSNIAKELAKTEVESQLKAEGTQALAKLDTAFRNQKLPGDLHLSITGGQGASVAAMIGLTATCQEVRLPLATWGSGTRRLAALTVAEQKQGESPVTLVDEIERGLEPYRQHALMRRLQEGKSQVFITTHSPSAIAAASKAAVWYVDHNGNIGPLDAKKIARHRANDPNTFLCRLAIIGEGATEVGFATALLQAALDATLEEYGVHLSDGVGHDNTLDVLQALSEGGLKFGGFADHEGKYPERWKKLEASLGPLLFRWKSGCIEENIINAVPEAKLEDLLRDPAGEDAGSRLRTLANRLDMTGEISFVAVAGKAGPKLKAVIIAAATGVVPTDKKDRKKEYKNHAQIWFKSLDGGAELARKLFSLGLWPTFKPVLLPFCNGVRAALDLPPVEDLKL